MEKRIEVKVAPAYEVILSDGALGAFTNFLEKRKESKCLIVCDKALEKLYLPEVKLALEKEDYHTEVYILEGGEEVKNISNYQALLDYLVSLSFTRTDFLLSLGGGTISDLVGFVAATYLRGIDFVSLPTTLLAMIDASVGGKTGINLEGGKNLCGAFKQPKLVYISTKVLESLDEVYFREGLAEMIKYAFLGQTYLMMLLSRERLEKTSESLFLAIYYSILKKVEIVTSDEKESGERKLLNFGHTFAHGIEKASSYHYRHGLAVAMGMHAVLSGAVTKGLVDKAVLVKLDKILKLQGLLLFPKVSKESIIQHALMDKKRSGNRLTLVLSDGKKGFLHEIAISDLQAFYREA